ncbi:MAG: hypothetical protein IPI04_18185 [Ignavibacteria bacterium]|nr:hypothetical protein [Ignavibacteria bacterium]
MRVFYYPLLSLSIITPAKRKKSDDTMKVASIETSLRIIYPMNGAKMPLTPVRVI